MLIINATEKDNGERVTENSNQQNQTYQRNHLSEQLVETI